MPTPVASPVSSDAMAMRVAALRAGFSRIQQQSMQDVPLLNPKLHVASVGFRPWQAYWLGVLITPWMMKLVGLPKQLQTQEQPEVNWQFPSGEYTLTLDVVEELGAYYSVSLFSPMQEFRDQAQAQATAVAVMQGLFAVPKQRTETTTPKQRDPARRMTRRDLLFGMFRDNKSG